MLLSTQCLSAKTENYLRHTYLKNNQLNLVFKYKVNKVNHFKIKGHGFVKHVYDIDGVSLPNNKNISQFKAKGIRTFRIAQFNKKMVRVVIESRVLTKGSFTLKGNKVRFILPSYKNISSSSSHVSRISKKRKSLHKRTSRIFKSTKRYHYNKKRRTKTIILDAGHGGRDIGASGYGVREKDITLSITLKLKRILQKMGYRVLMTHSHDKFMNLKQRTEYANRHRGSIFVSIHANAAPTRRTPHVLYKGIEVFYLSIKYQVRTAEFFTNKTHQLIMENKVNLGKCSIIKINVVDFNQLRNGGILPTNCNALARRGQLEF